MEIRENRDHLKNYEETGKRHHQHVAHRCGKPNDVQTTDGGEEQGTLDDVQSEDSDHKVK